MGTDCAPLLANLYLFHYKYKFMRQIMKNDLIPSDTLMT